MAGLVVGEEAIIEGGLAEEEQLDVQAMCLFAIELAAGERPGEYSDERAIAFARQARAQRSIAHNLAEDGRQTSDRHSRNSRGHAARSSSCQRHDGGLRAKSSYLAGLTGLRPGRWVAALA